MSHYNNQHLSPAPQQDEEFDLDDDTNASGEWDSRSTKSSLTINSNYSTQHIEKPYEQQAAPYQQNQIVDPPRTRKVRFPDGFRDLQRTDAQGSSGFSSAREKLLSRRVRRATDKLPTCSALLFV
jgi:hypothetical protein